MRPTYVSNTPDFYDQLEAAYRKNEVFDLVYVGGKGEGTHFNPGVQVTRIVTEYDWVWRRTYTMKTSDPQVLIAFKGVTLCIVRTETGQEDRPPLITRPTRDELWMRTAMLWSERSTCLRNKVGCVITDDDGLTALAIGYNGNARGLDNSCDAPGTQGACGCIHAEENALIKAPGTMKNKVLYTTTAPCPACAKRIINANIRKVVYANEYRDGSGIKLLRDAGIGLELLKIE